MIGYARHGADISTHALPNRDHYVRRGDDDMVPGNEEAPRQGNQGAPNGTTNRVAILTPEQLELWLAGYLAGCQRGREELTREQNEDWPPAKVFTTAGWFDQADQRRRKAAELQCACGHGRGRLHVRGPACDPAVQPFIGNPEDVL